MTLVVRKGSPHTCVLPRAGELPVYDLSPALRKLFGELEVDFIGREDLITNKRATGRTRDLADIEDLDG